MLCKRLHSKQYRNLYHSTGTSIIGTMDFGIINIKHFNTFLIFLTAIQLVVSVSVVSLMVSSSVQSLSTWGMIVSSALLLLLCMPVSLYLWWSSKDQVMRTLFAGISAGFVLMAASGILGYVLPMAVQADGVTRLSKVLMLASYMPILYALGVILLGAHKKLGTYLKSFIIFINAATALGVVYLAITGYRPESAFDIGIYTLSTLSDIAIFAISSMLILVYLPTKYRYIISIIFTYNLLSFLGDTINLTAFLGISDYTRYSDVFYIGMLAFTSTALLLYLLANVKPVTVEEINKKFDDARLLMGDIITQSPVGICISDTNGNVMTANESFLKIFKKQAAEVVGKANIFEMAAGLSDEMAACLQRMRRGDKVAEDGVRINIDGNKETFVSLKIFSTYDSEGSRSSYVVMAEDVTGRKRAEAELIEAKDQAELYIDLMGHDINNMNQIGMGYLELAIESLDLQDEQRALILKPLEVMSSSSQLINNVRKMRSALVDPAEQKRVDLESVLSGVVRSYHVAPGRDFIIKYDMVEKCYVMADDLLKDIFLNLLNNTVKHSTGALLVRVELAPVFQFGVKYYRVTVEDNGPGILDEMKPVIFDRVYRSKHKSGYSGLGLYLVKTLVDKYHGTITLEDRVKGDRKQGSRFIITLPAAT